MNIINNDDYGLYCPYRLQPTGNIQYLGQRLRMSGKHLQLLDEFNGGVTFTMVVKLKSLPNGNNAVLFNHPLTGVGDDGMTLSISTSNTFRLFYRKHASASTTINSAAITTDVEYRVTVTAMFGEGVKMWVNGSLAASSTTYPRQGRAENWLLLQARSGASGSRENFHGTVKNFQLFTNTGYLSTDDAMVLYDGGSGRIVENRRLPSALKDKCRYEFRFNQENGNVVRNTAVNPPPFENEYIPIEFPSRSLGYKGGGRWKNIAPPPPPPVADFTEVFAVGLYNGICINYLDADFIPQNVDDHELDVLRENSTPDRFQFSATTTNGSYIKGNVPLKDKMVVRHRFSTTRDNWGANTLSIPNGQDDGVTFYSPIDGQWALSIWHSGGTEERHLLTSGVIPDDGTEVDVDLLFYKPTSGDMILRVWVDGYLELDTTTTRSVEGLDFQIGQFKHSANALNRVTGGATPDEGIHFFHIWNVGKSTTPTEGEVLALVPTPKPQTQIVKSSISGVTGVVGHAIYYPLYHDPMSQYPFILNFHGAADGQDGLYWDGDSWESIFYPLNRLCKITLMHWLRQNNIEMMAGSPQFTNGTYSYTSIIAYLDYMFDPTTGIFKDQWDGKLAVYGYSKGAIELDALINALHAWNSNIKVYVLVAGNLNLSPSKAENIVANNSYVLSYSVDNDNVTNEISHEVLGAAISDINPSRVQVTKFEEFPSGSFHDIIQDLVYNNTGSTYPQVTGTYTQGGNDYPFTEWVDVTFWNKLRKYLYSPSILGVEQTDLSEIEITTDVDANFSTFYAAEVKIYNLTEEVYSDLTYVSGDGTTTGVFTTSLPFNEGDEYVLIVTDELNGILSGSYHAIGLTIEVLTFPPSYIEILYRDNLVSGDFTVNAGTFTFTGGNIELSGGTANFSHFARLTPSTAWAWKQHSLEAYRITVEVTSPSTINASSYGMGLGVDSLNSYEDNENIVRWSMDTSGTHGRRPVLYDTSGFTRQVVPSPNDTYSFAASTKYWLETERRGDIFYHKLYSDAAKTTLLDEWSSQPTSGYANTAWLWANAGNFAFWNFGGTMTIHSIKIELPNFFYAAIGRVLTVVGDSNTVGFKAGIANRYINQLVANTSLSASDVMVQAGIADRTDEVQLIRPAIQAANNQYIAVMIGTNDKRSGDTDATVNANWEAMMDDLIADNPSADFIIIVPPPLDAQNMSVIAAYQVAYATANSIPYIDCYTQFKDGGTALSATYDIGDGIHLNATAHTWIAGQLETILGL